jgi:hypothetical protein
MSIEGFFWFVIGIAAGAYWLESIYSSKQQKTLEQLDDEMRKDLERYRNLSNSLLADVQYWRDRYHTLQKIKDEQK